ncbi:uncharacterized protein PV06_10474 [Exophiala oligosperma]|uniref:Uncharacterized protein n=1 Tax=Exophiala oligosperma TaxID=215243 RepID=A0A0D2DNR7_9EURO|nr:uncharacterized protein PV06_10474 [Exophiala oligosperma]KIW37434.1 hypothetical protein PV06_10474 [Exophiala oligosperma]
MALPNLRRLFVEARTEAEENEYSRNATRYAQGVTKYLGSFTTLFCSFPQSPSSAWWRSA